MTSETRAHADRVLDGFDDLLAAYRSGDEARIASANRALGDAARWPVALALLDPVKRDAIGDLAGYGRRGRWTHEEIALATGVPVDVVAIVIDTECRMRLEAEEQQAAADDARRREERRRVRARACPACSAQPGEGCRTMSGAKAKYLHAARELAPEST